MFAAAMLMDCSIVCWKHIFKLIPVFAKLFDMLKLPPVINEYSIRKLCENCNFSNEKAQKELGFETRPLADSLRDTINWLDETEHIVKK